LELPAEKNVTIDHLNIQLNLEEIYEGVVFKEIDRYEQGRGS